ncbi:MAG: helix-turn-helix transcriptional regulator [Blautia sp.]|nr:helix-turn-helix transcriptional regulator [Blautia sp.]
MAVSYNKLWKLMIDKNLSKTELVKAAGITTNVMAKMGKCEPVRLEALAKICAYFDCKLDDIVDLIPDEKGAES